MPSVEFSDDESHVIPDKTEMARLKRSKRARQDEAEREDDDDDDHPMTMVNTRPLPKKRRNGVALGSTSSNGFGLSSQDKEKLVKVSEKLRKDADKLPVNEGESESSLYE